MAFATSSDVAVDYCLPSRMKQEFLNNTGSEEGTALFIHGKEINFKKSRKIDSILCGEFGIDHDSNDHHNNDTNSNTCSWLSANNSSIIRSPSLSLDDADNKPVIKDISLWESIKLEPNDEENSLKEESIMKQDLLDSFSRTTINGENVKSELFMGQHGVESGLLVNDKILGEGKFDGKYPGTASNKHYLKYYCKGGKISKVWECGICSRNFQHQYTLMRHLPTHSDVRNFICNECGKAFRQLSTLTQHQAIHSVERPYVCETCKKSFNRISTLISHRKTHSNIKPFLCPICGKGFHQKGNLRNHIYIHTNERPYRCPICGKGFNQMSNLVCHTQKSHSDQSGSVWHCQRCNMSFPKRSLLRAHELEAHRAQLHSSKNSRMRSHSNKRSQISNGEGSSRGKSSSKNNSHPKSSFVSSMLSPYTGRSFNNKILIPAIGTDAMITTKANNEIPFAVLHFLEGCPVLVRVLDYGDKNLLKVASADDFYALCKQQCNPHDEINIRVVADIFQTLNAEGDPEFSIRPPKNKYEFPDMRKILNSASKNDQAVQLMQNPDKITNSTLPIMHLTDQYSNFSSSILHDQTYDGLLPPINEFNVVMKGLLGGEGGGGIEAGTLSTDNGTLGLQKLYDENDLLMQDVIELSSEISSSSSTSLSNDEKPKAIAIVQNNNWWNSKVNREDTEVINEEGEENSKALLETFQNIATGSLLSPKRVQEESFTFSTATDNSSINSNYRNPMTNNFDQNFNVEEIDPEAVTDFLNNITPEEMENILRTYSLLLEVNNV